MNFVEDQTEHRFPLFRTDIDVIRSEDLMESVLMEKSEGVSRILFSYNSTKADLKLSRQLVACFRSSYSPILFTKHISSSVFVQYKF